MNSKSCAALIFVTTSYLAGCGTVFDDMRENPSAIYEIQYAYNPGVKNLEVGYSKLATDAVIAQNPSLAGYYEMQAANVWKSRGYFHAEVDALNAAASHYSSAKDYVKCSNAINQIKADAPKIKTINGKEINFILMEANVRMARLCFPADDVSDAKLAVVQEALSLRDKFSYIGYDISKINLYGSNAVYADKKMGVAYLSMQLLNARETLDAKPVFLRSYAEKSNKLGLKKMADEFEFLAKIIEKNDSANGLAAVHAAASGSSYYYDEAGKRASVCRELSASADNYANNGLPEKAAIRKKQFTYCQKPPFMTVFERLANNKTNNEIRVVGYTD